MRYDIVLKCHDVCFKLLVGSPTVVQLLARRPIPRARFDMTYVDGCVFVCPNRVMAATPPFPILRMHASLPSFFALPPFRHPHVMPCDAMPCHARSARDCGASSVSCRGRMRALSWPRLRCAQESRWLLCDLLRFGEGVQAASVASHAVFFSFKSSIFWSTLWFLFFCAGRAGRALQQA